MTAKKSAPAKSSKKATKSANAVDDILDGKSDDILEGKAAPAKKSKAAPAKKASGKTAKAAAVKKEKGETSARYANIEAARSVISKIRKSTSYADVAGDSLDIRLIRRTARVMRDEGLIDLEKEGTVVFIKPLRK